MMGTAAAVTDSRPARSTTANSSSSREWQGVVLLAAEVPCGSAAAEETRSVRKRKLKNNYASKMTSRYSRDTGQERR